MLRLQGILTAERRHYIILLQDRTKESAIMAVLQSMPREATFRKSSYTFQIVDLPGTYSITEYTPEELFVRKYISENNPDVVINVIDASNLERNLYLTTQLIDMNIKVVIALNMYDELEKKGAKLDYEALGKMIGIPIIPTIASKGIGIDELFQKIIDVYEDKDPIVRHIHINYGTNIEKAIARYTVTDKRIQGNHRQVFIAISFNKIAGKGFDDFSTDCSLLKY